MNPRKSAGRRRPSLRLERQTAERLMIGQTPLLDQLLDRRSEAPLSDQTLKQTSLLNVLGNPP